MNTTQNPQPGQSQAKPMTYREPAWVATPQGPVVTDPHRAMMPAFSEAQEARFAALDAKYAARKGGK